MKSIVNIRASSLSTLFDCPKRWAAFAIFGKTMATSSKGVLGQAIHTSTGIYDQSILAGDGITIDEAAGAAVDFIKCESKKTIWDDESPQEAEKIAISLHKKYCTLIAPKQSYKAVEVTCNDLVIKDLGLRLTGTTDRIRESDNGYGIVDLKSGKQAVGTNGVPQTKGHAYQQGVYELIAEFGSGMKIEAPAQIIGMNTAKTDAGQRIGSAEIEGCRQLLLGDENNVGVLQHASNLIHSGNFYGNPKSMMCHKNYCPEYQSCNYRK